MAELTLTLDWLGPGLELESFEVVVLAEFWLFEPNPLDKVAEDEVEGEVVMRLLRLAVLVFPASRGNAEVAANWLLGS